MRRALWIAAICVFSLGSAPACGDDDSDSTSEDVSTDPSSGQIDPDDYLNAFEMYLADLELEGYGDLFASDDAARLYLTNLCDSYDELGEAAIEDDIDRISTKHCP